MKNNYKYSTVFKKQFRKLPEKIRKQFYNRLQLFDTDPTHPRLRVHPLKGKYAGYWSMDITGDIRALYQDQGGHLILLAFIGTHSEL